GRNPVCHHLRQFQLLDYAAAVLDFVPEFEHCAPYVSKRCLRKGLPENLRPAGSNRVSASLTMTTLSGLWDMGDVENELRPSLDAKIGAFYRPSSNSIRLRSISMNHRTSGIK